MKNTRSADFCSDQTGIITIFSVITNVVIKRVHCISLQLSMFPILISKVSSRIKEYSLDKFPLFFISIFG